MKLSYSWLMQYTDEPISPDALSNILTSVGLEVEHSSSKEMIPGGLKGVVIGKVLTCEKHPNADKLKLTTVDIGAEAPVQIVCGAPNVAAGQTVVVATVGCTLHPLGGDAFKINKAKIRGEESFGMICAEDELGLGESHDGIIVINEQIQPGTAAAQYFKLPQPDMQYEIGLTPNRMDAMSHMGAMRDVLAFISNEKGILKTVQYPKVEMPPTSANLPFDITIEDPIKCPRYMGVSIANVQIAESPVWLQDRLRSIDIQPINNVVDITNFVLHECGQPLHAFDYDKIVDGKIIVRTASQNETFITLDEKSRKLEGEDLVIANPTGPMCIAGVFGGAESGVKPETRNIFLESAFFESTGIRKTSVHHALRTEASARYEKGADLDKLEFALKRAAQLICEIAGGSLASEVMDVYPNPLPRRKMKVEYQTINDLSGKHYSHEQVNMILQALNFELLSTSEKTFEIAIPYAKPDIEFDADIVEEIMRIDGIDNIPFTGEIRYSVPNGTYEINVKRATADLLVGKGLFEIVTNSITNSQYYPEQKNLVFMMNSLSSSLNIMRPSMLETALECIAYNLNRKNDHLKFFEFGKTYNEYNGRYVEQDKLCIYLSGLQHAPHWQQSARPIDIYYCKGLVQSVFPFVSIDNKHAVSIDKKMIGAIQLVDKEKLKQFGIEHDVWFIELDWKALNTALNIRKSKFSGLPKYPGTTRDLALVLDKEVEYAAVEQTIRKVVSDKLVGLDVFDVFESEKLGNNKKSYAVRLDFLDKSKTIVDQEVDTEMNRIIKALEQSVGAEIRS